MSKNPYENEDELTSFATQFATVVAEEPEKYRVTPEEVTRLKSQVEGWANARTANIAAKDAAKSTTQAKQLTRAELTDLLRDLGRRIQADSNVSDAARAEAGLPVHKPSRTPVAVPKTAPIGQIHVEGPLQHSVRFTADTHRGRPEGVIACRIYVAFGEKAPGSLENYRMVAQTGRSPFVMSFNAEESGKLAHYVLRWVNSREEVGPMSSPISATVPAL